jgi:hypothetical protein
MQALPNIERSAFHHGEYVGYCDGARPIRRYGNGWRAMVPSHRTGTLEPMVARTLRELADALAQRADLIAEERKPVFPVGSRSRNHSRSAARARQ